MDIGPTPRKRATTKMQKVLLAGKTAELRPRQPKRIPNAASYADLQRRMRLLGTGASLELVQRSTRDSLTQGANTQKFLWGKLFS